MTTSKDFPSFEFFKKAMETQYEYRKFADNVYEVLNFDNFENKYIMQNITMYFKMLSYIFNDKIDCLHYFTYGNPILSDDFCPVEAIDNNNTNKRYNIKNITDLYMLLKDVDNFTLNHMW